MPGMKAYFWGTRGSLPASFPYQKVEGKIMRVLRSARGKNLETDDAIKAFFTAGVRDGSLPFSALGAYGTNTSCMEIVGGNQYVICDSGTGIRDFGNHLLASGGKADGIPRIFNIFMSHLHWDHIQGFPFFTPAYMPGNVINIYGLHEELERAFVVQQEHPFFPVPLKSMPASINFTILEPDKVYEIAGFTIRTQIQNHPGTSYGYRFEKNGKSVVYSTDSEHKDEAYEDNYPFLEFFHEADLLIFDSQYPLLDAISSKEDWGHSSNIMAVELSIKAHVKHLCIFHNEPTFDDDTLDRFLDDTRRYLHFYSESSSLKIDLAYDGFEIEVDG